MNRMLLLSLFLLLQTLTAPLVTAQVTEDRATPRRPDNYRSRNFLVHTDLAKKDAEELLQKMETMLQIISRYWGAPSRKMIECYVIDDVKLWPAGSLPQDAASAISGGGLTVARGVRRGNQLNMNAIVYASNRFGTPQHEAVHAYCYQTFGATGPTWYAEGMAELGNYWVENNPTVTAPNHVIRHLKQTQRKTLAEITDNRQQTGDGWRNYAWRWALCHFLANNSNYRDRFRLIGVGFLTGKPASFERAFETQMAELDFEFQFFLDHLEQGFDVDRCSWNWKSRFRAQKGSRPVVSKIRADKGWQPSGLKVIADQTYALTTSGTWRTSDSSEELSADGDAESAGRLVATIYDDHQITREFELGKNLSFTATATGQLMLRCRDGWNELSDNKGTLSVELMSVPDEEGAK